MSKIPYLTEEEVAPRIREYWEKAPFVLNINRVAAHAEAAYRPCLAMGFKLLTKAELPHRLRELAILRIAHLRDARYEWEHHVRLAQTLGFSENEIEGVKNPEQADCFPDLEQAVLHFTDELIQGKKASDTNMEKLEKNLSHRQIVELILSVGYWNMIAMLIVNAGVELEKT